MRGCRGVGLTGSHKVMQAAGASEDLQPQDYTGSRNVRKQAATLTSRLGWAWCMHRFIARDDGSREHQGPWQVGGQRI